MMINRLMFMNLIRNLFASNSVEFKVNTEDLIASAELIESNADQMIAEYDHFAEIVTKTSYYWEGIRADERRQDLISNNEKIMEALKRIKSYVNTLQTIARKYDDTEAINVNEAESLPIDIIS